MEQNVGRPFRPFYTRRRVVAATFVNFLCSTVDALYTCRYTCSTQPAGMNITGIFIERPVMTTLVMGAIVLFGITAYYSLPVSDLPNVDFPTLQVSAALPGASPETMASSIATPLEQQFATIAGIDSMTSSRGIGSTSITFSSCWTGRLTLPRRTCKQLLPLLPANYLQVCLHRRRFKR